MNYIKIAKETIEITNKRCYEINEATITLPDMDYTAVKVYSPEAGAQLMQEGFEKKEATPIITITTEDSYQAASRYDNSLVMNFANAHNPGGGFTHGAVAQEEALCRCSTLYASINSKEASEMYKYNNTHLSQVESDYMLYSDVCVFRNQNYELLQQPFTTSVITVPAPNRMGAAILASEKTIEETMLRRIRILLLIAYKNGCDNLILGAWGCGAFRNDPKKVARYFKQVIIAENYGCLFKEICFAIYGKEDGKNITAFKNEFRP